MTPTNTVGTLSGGELQSVAIARAVYFGAKALILDEPTSALGVRQSGMVLKYIVAARDAGLGVIFITHNPHHAYPVGDRFLILKRGRSLGNFPKAEISRDELTKLMAGGAELEELAHEIESVAPEAAEEIRAMTDLELLTVGRISVDLYADQPGAGFDGPQRFEKSIGGSPTNVAVAAARLGHAAAVITKVGADPFGEYVRAKLEGFGVDTRYVGTHPSWRTPLAFAALTPPEDPEILFYREPAAPDTDLAGGRARRRRGEGHADRVGERVDHGPRRVGRLRRPLARRTRDRRGTRCSTWTTGRCSGARGRMPNAASARPSTTARWPSATVSSARWRSARQIPRRQPAGYSIAAWSWRS